ncbi:hypothetical protein [Streptomyces sp. NPDC090021]|uniref:hypothetical protein n=1 Tax=Streptomyces sp. NPDC090021 TaxID=3365919 RepID=UPI0037FC2B70
MCNGRPNGLAEEIDDPIGNPVGNPAEVPMPVAELLVDDLLELDDLTVEDLLKVEADDTEIKAALCSCCCSWCAC